MRSWPLDPALVLLAVTGIVHVIRGAPVDAAIFLGVAAALAATELIKPDPVATQPRQFPNRPLFVLAGSVLFGIAVGWAQFSVFSETVLIVVGVLALLAVWRQGEPNPTATPPVRYGALAWVALALTWCGWELVSFVHEVNVDDVSIGHPTMSDIVEPLLSHQYVRWLALTAWIAAGYGLVRIGRRAAR